MVKMRGESIIVLSPHFFSFLYVAIVNIVIIVSKISGIVPEVMQIAAIVDKILSLYGAF